MKTIEVVAAIIQNDTEILCVQRGVNKRDYISFKYEFPGGKIESNETEEEALIREIWEELNIEVSINSKFLTVDYAYPDFRLIMHSFLCTSANRDVRLTEHVASIWLPKNDLFKLDWAAADIPIVKQLQQQ